MSASDKFLVNQFLQKKDEKHFIPLYRSHADTIYRLALFLTKHNEMLAKDLVQETWFVVVEKLPGFAWRSSLRTWITGILMNKYRSGLRNNKTYDELTPDLRIETPVSTEITAMDLKRAILQLPPGYREVIVMHDLEGFKHHEIAELLNISEGTCKSQLFNARRHMRKLLQGYERSDCNDEIRK